MTSEGAAEVSPRSRRVARCCRLRSSPSLRVPRVIQSNVLIFWDGIFHKFQGTLLFPYFKYNLFVRELAMKAYLNSDGTVKDS